MSPTSEAEGEAPWLKVLSRWALAYGVYEVAALLAFATMVGFDVLGPGAFEAAARSPATFRIAAGLDLTPGCGLAAPCWCSRVSSRGRRRFGPLSWPRVASASSPACSAATPCWWSWVISAPARRLPRRTSKRPSLPRADPC